MKRTNFQIYINDIMEKAVDNDDLDRIRYRIVFDGQLTEADAEFLTRLTYLVGAWYNSHKATRRTQEAPQRSQRPRRVNYTRR